VLFRSVLERERFAGGRNEFVNTPTMKRIGTFCDLIRESQSPGFITGPSHCGKTTGLERYAQDNNHGRTVYIRMKAASGLGGMVRRIAEKVGVSSNANTADLIDRIKRACTPDMVLIMDEVHLLANTYRKASFFACIEVIREIHDEVGCGMVLCGTTLLLDKLQEGSHKEMEQILRRGVHRMNLPPVVAKYDIAPILEHWGLEFPKASLEIEIQGITEKPFEILRQLAAKQGLKAICERLRYARKLAARAGKRVTWGHFVEAHLTIAKQADVKSDWSE
jgi:DNA transposition AAA+ family ATPase